MFSHIPAGLIAGFRCARLLPGMLRKLPAHPSLQCSSRMLFSSFDKDLPTPNQLTPLEKLHAQDTDILLEQLRKAPSVHRVLELVSMHIDVMNNNHIIACFNVIDEVVKDGQAGLIEHQDIRQNEVFQSLCVHTMNRMRYFQSQDVISVLKTLTKLKVHSNTYIMQALLKMLCSQINELSLNQLTFLNFLLSRLGHNSLVDSLKLALPLVLQVQIDQQLDSDNLHQMIECLSMACRSKLKSAVIEKILSCLQTKIMEINAAQASSIIFSLFSLNVSAEGYLGFIKAAFDIVSNNIDQVPRTTLLSLTRMCVKQSFYFRSFFMRLSERATAERWGLEECSELIPRLHKLNFFSSELLELLTSHICQNSAALHFDEKFCILTLSECLSFVDYQPKQLDGALAVLSSASDKIRKLCDHQPHLYLKLITCWAMLGYFPCDLIFKILNDKYLYGAWSLSKKYSRTMEFESNLCYLSWALDYFGQTEQLSLPAVYINRIFNSLYQKEKKTRQYPLTKFLEIGLGGSQFFRTGVFTRGGHPIDHVLSMRNGNYPIALGHHSSNSSAMGEQISFVEDIHVFDGSKIIAIIVVGPNDYTTDPEILKSPIALRVKSLSRMSLIPVVIKYESWYNLPDREKIPYLMREIKSSQESAEHVTANSFPFT